MSTQPLHIQTIPTDAETIAIIQTLSRYVAGYTIDPITKEALMCVADGILLSATQIEYYTKYWNDYTRLYTSGDDVILRVAQRMGIVVMYYAWSNYQVALHGLCTALYVEGWNQAKLNDVVNKVIADVPCN